MGEYLASQHVRWMQVPHERSGSGLRPESRAILLPQANEVTQHQPPSFVGPRSQSLSVLDPRRLHYGESLSFPLSERANFSDFRHIVTQRTRSCSMRFYIG